MSDVDVHVVGDGIAGLLVARELSDRELSVCVWGDGAARAPTAALVHRHAGRSFRTDDLEDAAWVEATSFLDGLVARGVTRRTEIIRPADDDRLARSRDAATDPRAIAHEEDPTYGAVFRYGPAYVVDVERALEAVVTDLEDAGVRFERRRVDPAELSGRVVLACGASLPRYVDGHDLRLFGGHVVTFVGELDCAVSGRGFHAVPFRDGQVAVGSTWWPPDEPMPDHEAIDELRSAATRGGVELGDAIAPWRGMRCVRHPERRPLVTRPAESVWVCGALGTRGWFWAPQAALDTAMSTHSLAGLPER